MTTLVATIFVLGILIFFHELGHFLVAKRSGIRVEKFSLGFPPKMIGKKIGDTEYCLSWIPLGGYVKMAGEDPE
ncbi:MAG: site-2 protease family protein, partial [Candidatus Zixiibacteriota bacterium]